MTGPASVAPDPDPGSGADVDADIDGDAALARYATALLIACEAALPGWIERSVVARADAWQAGLGERLRPDAAAAGRRALDEVGPRLRASLLADAQAQVASPLSILRSAVTHPTEVLQGAGVPEVARDEFEVQAFPSDRYRLAPAAFADVDPRLHEPGLAWGAAKAYVVLARRRR